MNQSILSPAFIRRDLNDWANALSKADFRGFDQARRIPTDELQQFSILEMEEEHAQGPRERTL